MTTETIIKFYYDTDNFLAYIKRWHGEKVMILLHGMWASHKSWHDFQHYFHEEEYTLYLIDLKGYGYSSKPRDDKYSIADQAEIITLFMEQLNLKDVIVLWHSLWGGVGLYTYIMANRLHKDSRIAKVILIDTMAFKNELPLLYNLIANRFTMWFIYTFSTARFKAKYTLLRACRIWKEIWKEMIERYAYFLKGEDMKYVLTKTAQQLIRKDYDETIGAYKTIKVPVLIIRWEKDPILPAAHGRKLHEMIPHSSLVIIPRAWHVTHEEDTLATYNAIDKRLDNQKQ